MKNIKTCLRYETKLFGADLVKAIKDKFSNILLLFIFFATILIGYLSFFDQSTSEDETISSEDSSDPTLNKNVNNPDENNEIKNITLIDDKFSQLEDFEEQIESDILFHSLNDETLKITKDYILDVECKPNLKADFTSQLNLIINLDDSQEKSVESNIHGFSLDKNQEDTSETDSLPVQKILDKVHDVFKIYPDEFIILDQQKSQEEDLTGVKSSEKNLSDKTLDCDRKSRWEVSTQDTEPQQIPINLEINQFDIKLRSVLDNTNTDNVTTSNINSPGDTKKRLSFPSISSESDTVDASRLSSSVLDVFPRRLSLETIPEEEWQDRESFFKTLNSARSSISSSGINQLIASVSQENLSMKSSTDSSINIETTDSDELKLHRNIKQLYGGCITDRFSNLNDLAQAIQQAGLIHSRVIIGIDYTKSNVTTGLKTFNGKCLHTIDPQIPNPYQEVIRILCNTLNQFDEDNLICAFGFGDSWTSDRYVFKLNPASIFCRGFEGVLASYNLTTPNVKLGGPTTFAPLIRESIQIVQSSNTYTILIIIADGQIVDEEETINAIVEASEYPISIVLVGVGDGPWDKMKEFDDALPHRMFDNFQFVNYHEVCKLSQMLPRAQQNSADYLFALMALMEIPDQYMIIKKLRYLEQKNTTK